MLNMSRTLGMSSEGHEIPVDRRVPGMARLLDPQTVAALPQLTALWGDRFGCQITYVRYKPDTNCLIAYAIQKPDVTDSQPSLCYAKCFPESEYESAVAKLEQHRWVETRDFPSAIPLPDLSAVIYLFPNDSHLDGLRILATPKKIQRALYAHDLDYPEDTWRISDRRLRVTPVRYKPERRAVLKLNTRAVHRQTGEKRPLEAYMSIFTDDRGRAIYRTMSELHTHVQLLSQVTTPRPYAFIEDRGAILVEGLEGTPIAPAQKRFTQEVAAQSAHALAALHEWHGGSLRSEGLTEIQDRVQSTARTLAQIAPGVEQVAQHVANRLNELAPSLQREAGGFVHGDFYYGQVLFGGSKVAVVDFERSYRGDAAADVGNYCAHIRLAGLNGQLDNDAALISTFVHEYRATASISIPPQALHFWTALGLYLLAVQPFRTLESGWRQKTDRILRLCAELVA